MQDEMPCICGAKTENILRHRAVFFQLFNDMGELSAAQFELPKTKGKVLIAILEVDE